MGVNLTETLKGIPGLQLNNRENYARFTTVLCVASVHVQPLVPGYRLYVDGILQPCPRWTRPNVKY
jgi:iron complex outermembrane receptor protein